MDWIRRLDERRETEMVETPRAAFSFLSLAGRRSVDTGQLVFNLWYFVCLFHYYQSCHDNNIEKLLFSPCLTIFGWCAVRVHMSIADDSLRERNERNQEINKSKRGTEFCPPVIMLWVTSYEDYERENDNQAMIYLFGFPFLVHTTNVSIISAILLVL